MGLNKVRGNMYQHITNTWNTVKGACGHDCSYCYMKRWGAQKPAHFDEKELKTDLGRGLYIFVGSSNDLFGPHVKDEWIDATLSHISLYPTNKYMFQSKNPGRIIEWLAGFPARSVIGTTIESNRNDQRCQAPDVEIRADALSYLKNTPVETFVTIEPIMDFDLIPMADLIKTAEPDTVNIGADSGNNNLPEPHEEKIRFWVQALREYGIRVNCKPNLKRLYDGGK